MGVFGVAAVANAFSQPSERHPVNGDAQPGGLSLGCCYATPSVQSNHAPEGHTPGLTKGGPSTERVSILPPLFLPSGDTAQLNLARARVEHNILRLPVDRNVLCYPTEHKVNSRTLQPRHSTMYTLRLGQTTHDQEVRMVQPNRRGRSTPVRGDAPWNSAEDALHSY